MRAILVFTLAVPLLINPGLADEAANAELDQKLQEMQKLQEKLDAEKAQKEMQPTPHEPFRAKTGENTSIGINPTVPEINVITTKRS